jgi:hypothetical protein
MTMHYYYVQADQLRTLNELASAVTFYLAENGQPRDAARVAERVRQAPGMNAAQQICRDEGIPVRWRIGDGHH